MPTNPFFEVSPQQRHIGPPADASDYTRYVRLAASIAPYVNNKVTVPGRPTLGWKSPRLAAEVAVISPIFGQFNAFLPNRR